jgi:hypothetical protein
MCFYDSISTFVTFLMHHINLCNIFVDVLRIGMFANNCDGRPLIIFHKAAPVRNLYAYTYAKDDLAHL